ncbi:MAG: 4-(cytidine 5'-diphospho)-2-C-methyl-D-erythritol kinase [Microbacteriaceae bacterium]|nr:4-(cytidine 5'-diphospho)-2-C-methyl-D-erythritol kinase [Microbacteriaceae bacterium]
MGKATGSGGETARSVTARAPGKLNLVLRIGALQNDGYHEVASLYQAVSLFEEVTATPSDGFSVRFAGPIDGSFLPTDDSNLVIRAAKLLAHTMGITEGAALTVVKRVPIAGGMGGGSADAAATLVACDELWGTGLGRTGLLPLAAELGADVPFALEGGTAIGTGRGDQLTHALSQGEFHWVIVFSEHGLSTPIVYAELDAHRRRHSAALLAHDTVSVDAAALQAVRSGDHHALADALQNDMQAAALRLRPELGELLEFGESHESLAGIVAGSGPSCAFLMPHALAAAELQSALVRGGYDAVAVRGPVRGACVLDRG